MRFQLTDDTIDSIKSDLVIVNYFKEDINIKEQQINDEVLNKLNEESQGLILQSVQRKETTGESGKILLIPKKERAIMLIGCGKREEYSIEDHKMFAAQAIRKAKKHAYTNLSFYPRGLEDIDTIHSLLIEGMMVGDYSFDLFKSKEDDSNPKIELDIVNIIIKSDQLQQQQDMLKEGSVIGESVKFVRDLINRPANECTPTILSEQAKEFAGEGPIKITVFDKNKIKKMKMGSFLSVARGAIEPPKFIVMRYEPANKKTDEKIALVGKGITFDTGGISLKPALNMHEMKADMSGAAVVIGAIVAIARLNLGIEVIALVPTTENMPSGTATKPGDIVTAMNGKTIEILNTDAEGRLILADALAYAVQEKADKIIDIATLTGACVIALGEITTGLLGNNQDFIDHFIKISNDAGEKVWQLPLFKKYREQIKSEVADIANIGGKPAGTITSAAFLENFVDKTPWIHLDIAGTGYTSKDAYYSKGGTGAMVTSIVRFVKDLASK